MSTEFNYLNFISMDEVLHAPTLESNCQIAKELIADLQDVPKRIELELPIRGNKRCGPNHQRNPNGGQAMAT